MKRLTLLLATIGLTAISVNAQKAVVVTESFSDTQARMVEVTAKSYVRPLIVDLKVIGPRTTFTKQYSETEVKVAMGGKFDNFDNLRSRAIYDASEKLNCDAIVAATFKIELTPDGKAFNLEMKGFPANFDQTSWHPMNEKDYQWLEVDKMVSSGESKQTGVVISNVKK